VSELEWQIFLRDEVTRRFPEGLTASEAEGQWRTPAGSIDHEQSKVRLLVHPIRRRRGVSGGKYPANLLRGADEPVAEIVPDTAPSRRANDHAARASV
jgi:hypothetical protein